MHCKVHSALRTNSGGHQAFHRVIRGDPLGTTARQIAFDEPAPLSAKPIVEIHSERNEGGIDLIAATSANVFEQAVMGTGKILTP